jgi:hypothetical protein
VARKRQWHESQETMLGHEHWLSCRWITGETVRCIPGLRPTESTWSIEAGHAPSISVGYN